MKASDFKKGDRIRIATLDELLASKYWQKCEYSNGIERTSKMAAEDIYCSIYIPLFMFEFLGKTVTFKELDRTNSFSMETQFQVDESHLIFHTMMIKDAIAKYHFEVE